MNKKKFLSYKDAGVDIDASNSLIFKIKDIAKKTYRSEILSELGGFGALCTLSNKYSNPVLVSVTDGIGTKLRLAINLNRYNNIGIDLVAMCVNDIIVYGAEPLFFLDYYATSKLNIDTAEIIINSIAEGCIQSGCSLVGGETAELPGIYQKNDYDIAGFCLGIVEKFEIINGSKVTDGDVIIALGSSGLHSNGYSLVQKILEINNYNLLDIKLDGKLLIDHLMTPTRIYVKNVLELIKNVNVHAICHLTGGSFWDNIPRILPNNTQAIIDESSWKWHTIFKWLQEIGNISRYEMYRTFNCGVGMIIILPATQENKAIRLMKEKGEKVWKIGEIKKSSSNERVILI